MMRKTLIGMSLLGLAIVIGLTGTVSAQFSDGLPLASQMQMSGSYIDVSGISFVSDTNGLSLFSGGSAPLSYPSAPMLGYTISAQPLGEIPTIGDISAYSNSHSMGPGGEFSYNQYTSASGIINNFYFSTSYTG
jgi:hypothetical protein